jgi:YcxB-like protein
VIARYSLSWDEFMEVHQRSLPKPPVASSAVMILVALALGAYGGAVLYAVEPQDRPTASVFCWFSIILFAVALWDLTARTKKRRKSFIQGHRSSYDRQYVGEQELAFDQGKWTHGNQDGKYEVSWTGLLHAIEYQNVITFWTESYTVTVPKRVLGGNSEPGGTHAEERPLDVLRRLMFGESHEVAQCSVGLMDYLLTEIPALWRRRPTVMAEAHAVGFLVFLWIADGIRHSTEEGVMWGWIIAAVVLFLTVTTQLWYFLIQYYTALSEIRDSWDSWFSERGICGKHPKMEYFSAWTSFKKFRETRRAFLLYMNATQYYIHPKRCLTPERQTMLREFLQARIGTE